MESIKPTIKSIEKKIKKDIRKNISFRKNIKIFIKETKTTKALSEFLKHIFKNLGIPLKIIKRKENAVKIYPWCRELEMCSFFKNFVLNKKQKKEKGFIYLGKELSLREIRYYNKKKGLETYFKVDKDCAFFLKLLEDLNKKHKNVITGFIKSLNSVKKYI